LGTLYQRLKLCKGSKRAAVAVAHKILVIAYHLLSNQTTYRELGSNYLDRQDRERVSQQLKRRLERLGYKVSLETNRSSDT
jgi:transposase